MSKFILLTGASIVVFSTAVQAMDGVDTENRPASHLHHASVSSKTNHEKLSAETIVDFSHYSYAVAKPAQEMDWDLHNKLANAGWTLDAFKGTTGGADSQVESASGVLAFNGDHIVIAMRGTQMANLNDWKANARLCRKPLGWLYNKLTWNTEEAGKEAEKDKVVGAQHFGGVSVGVAAGFLQTHLSSWDYIKTKVLEHAQETGKAPSDFHYTVLGHSQGGAKAQLAALGLLTDQDLGIGLKTLEASYILSKNDIDSSLGASVIGEDGFHVMSKKSEAKNEGNVEVIAFESPRVFTAEAAPEVNKILGTNNVVRVENRGRIGVDPVVIVAPEFLGFKHVGAVAEVNKGILAGRHKMGNVGPAVLENKVIEKHRDNVAAAHVEITKKGGFLNGVKSLFKKVSSFFRS